MKTNTLKSFLTITLAMFIISVAIYFFLIPSEVITGSITGLAMVLAKITSLSISTLTFVINALLLILGIVLIGKEFGAKTIYASLLLPLFLAVFEKIYPNNVSLTQNARHGYLYIDFSIWANHSISCKRIEWWNGYYCENCQ